MCRAEGILCWSKLRRNYLLERQQQSSCLPCLIHLCSFTDRFVPVSSLFFSLPLEKVTTFHTHCWQGNQLLAVHTCSHGKLMLLLRESGLSVQNQTEQEKVESKEAKLLNKGWSGQIKSMFWLLWLHRRQELICFHETEICWRWRFPKY